MTSLRSQLTAALLATSLLAIAVVGGTARWLMLDRFDDLVEDRAVEVFSAEIIDYYQAHGSWDAARAAETLFEFRARTGARFPGPHPPSDGEGFRPPPPPRPGGAPGPPPRPAGAPAPSRGRFAYGGAPPPFVVVDQGGVMLLDLARRRVGDVIAPERLAHARPILVDGSEIGRAVSLERPVLTALEERYLSAIEDSWLYSLIVAVALSIPVGIVFGTRFTAPIRELTLALKSMRGTDLRQSVRVRSGDEIGDLSVAFNQMSADLSDAHHELEASGARLAEQAALLEEQSRRDELTQLPNRRAFNEQTRLLVVQAQRYGRSLTLGMADIDQFKQVNDNFSHATGDAVLRQVSCLISEHIREIDLVGRYGGEEFALAFPETDVAAAAEIADRVRELVARHDWTLVAPGLSVTLSIGLAGAVAPASLEQQLSLADAKLYEAKTRGRNHVSF